MISGRKLFDLYPLIFSALPTLATHILAPGLIVQEEMVNSSETPAALLWPNATNALFLIRADQWSNLFFALLFQCINVKSSDDGLDKVCRNDALQSCRYISTHCKYCKVAHSYLHTVDCFHCIRCECSINSTWSHHFKGDGNQGTKRNLLRCKVTGEHVGQGLTSAQSPSLNEMCAKWWVNKI